MGEFDYIRWLRGQVGQGTVRIGIGDDCAVVDTSSATLITTDMLLDGSHFILADVGPERVGRKALAVNLSDIAAMGGRPTAAVVGLALPRRGANEIGEAIFRGMKPLADEFGVAIAGGDTNTWNGPLVVSVTLLGEAGPHGPILRSGACPGDWLMVTGSLGGSILGKHLDFTPRVREARALQDHVRPTSMIDVSDGLAADVGHLAEESGVGFVLVAERIPIADAARQLSGDAIQHALGDGEDFELAFTVSPEDGKRLLETQPLGVPVSWVGVCTAESGLNLETAGRREPLPPIGYTHPFDAD